MALTRGQTGLVIYQSWGEQGFVSFGGFMRFGRASSNRVDEWSHFRKAKQDSTGKNVFFKKMTNKGGLGWQTHSCSESIAHCRWSKTEPVPTWAHLYSFH